MKSWKAVIIGISFLPALVIAQQPAAPQMGRGHMMQGEQREMAPAGMACMLMPRGIVPTDDGGIVALVGNKLIKYDKDLNMVKEVEIKVDFEALKGMVEKMRAMCPECPMGMGAGPRGRMKTPAPAQQPPAETQTDQ